MESPLLNFHSKTVYVVEDNELYALGLQQMIERSSEFLFVGHADSILKAVAECQRLKPRIVLLDIQFKGETGVSAIRALRAQDDQPLIAVITNHSDSRLVSMCEMAGANAFILKDEPLSQVLNKLRRMRPNNWCPPANWCPKTSSPRLGKEHAIAGWAVLSPREIATMKLLGQGLQELDAAERLFVSLNTLRNHRKSIYKKMGFKTKTDLVLFCRENEIL